MGGDNFEAKFRSLTDNPPFPWQKRLYERFAAGNCPSACDLPTGLGKTSVIAIWLVARQVNPTLPRRLVYVVNRRTVVDQTTSEVERYKLKLPDLGLSTLRGQFADNREWSADPSRPSVVVGTVDMIGSRLLFGGYGAGFKTRPLYAGLLGCDALIVHDEAHLEPAFQKLIERVAEEQKREKTALGEQYRLRIMSLSATARGGVVEQSDEIFRLGNEDLAHPEVKKRIEATKRLHLIESAGANKLADEFADLATTKFNATGTAVLIFVRKVDDVEKVVARIKKVNPAVQSLTGTMRGFERERLLLTPVFQRFLPQSSRAPGVGSDEKKTCYLVCTSAGEVGVNISADHMLSDLSTFESMAQRLGRVNRFGLRGDTEIHIFHAAKIDEKEDPDGRLRKTLELLRLLDGDGSPKALGALNAQERLAAFALPPTILSGTDVHFDAWAMTTIRDSLPGRPPLEPYLHGLRELDPPETRVAWREEVGRIRDRLLDIYDPNDLLEDYPLKPHELLRDNSSRIFKHLVELAKKHSQDPIWVIDDEGKIADRGKLTLDILVNQLGREFIENKTVLLSPTTGGLRPDGMMDGKSDGSARDVADEYLDELGRSRRARVWGEDDTDKTRGMRLIRPIELPPTVNDAEDARGEAWNWYERPFGGDSDGSKSAPEPIRLDNHVNDVVRNVLRFLESLDLPTDLKDAIVVAAKLHDEGKKRIHWQRSIGNPNPKDWHAKSGKRWKPRDITPYRHEYGSLVDAHADKELEKLGADGRDLALHLIAAHHGYGRPHFPAECTIDCERPTAATKLAIDVPQRYARLQRKYGRWGLAFLESLLRTADYEASAHPSSEEVRR